MKLWREIKQEFLQLRPILSKGEALSQWRYMVDFYFSSLTHPSAIDDLSVSPVHQQTLPEQFERLRNGEPIQHIVGFAWFDDMQFMVNKHVLIPRQETEELVYLIKDEVQQPEKIIDIGTGSGAIALSLAQHFPSSKIYALDVSAEALKVARINAQKLNIPNVEFIQNDVLSMNIIEVGVDVIVSNPPYITNDHKTKMDGVVTDFEPHAALFVPNDEPLLFYKKISRLAKLNSQSSGKSVQLFFEINEFFVEEVKQLLSNEGFQRVSAKRDLNGNWRMAYATFTPL